MARLNMRVRSAGDCLRSGIYHVLARFKRSVYFAHGRHVVSLVDASVGKGPNHIVVQDLDIGAVHSIEITDSAIYIDGTACMRGGISEYSSRLEVCGLNVRKLRKSMCGLERGFFENASKNSFPNLVGNNRRGVIGSRLDELLAQQLAAGRRALKQGALEAGVNLLIGAGYGLTPSGDDFVAGYCSGMHLGAAGCSGLRSCMIEIIENACGKTNVFSRTILGYCCEARFYEKAKALLAALISGTTADVYDSASAVCTVGETSGTDFSFGLLCALKDIFI
jgi:hypothetical protein